MTPQQLYQALWALKCQGQPYTGYAELTRQALMRSLDWTADGDPREDGVLVPAGTTVRIVMVSRFGDVGITTRLDTPYGYGLRTPPEDGLLKNCRLTRGTAREEKTP